ncbi:uracil-DNA glycosylase [Intestinibaculum porci]|uniref:uracil-DNA glycosylase n=1 Tax=Intestinibaculum porci TaxID=2487118 RepID=UPI00240A35CE|nr:uracil-DNA glycosylase [Intestinibaculum porci]MDD6349415.1 uracil-DNA glycosylase [Intestinibaculum porci]MDD6422852.1 uracil-DNA glycosylase [Intestinibaculum porci]
MRTFREIINTEAKEPYYQALHQFVEDEYATHTIFPPHKQIYHAFNFCDYEDIKVVILGQDPYHELHQANGLAFSVNKGVRIPPSLINIYKEAMSDVGIPQPHSGDLTPWARQGVLLLNTVLTVREGMANSHKGHGWEIFTDHIIEAMNEREKPVVFILWGRAARNKAQMIHERHLVIESAHPSPLSANRGFFGSRPFSRTNAFLREHGIAEIDWRID